MKFFSQFLVKFDLSSSIIRNERFAMLGKLIVIKGNELYREQLQEDFQKNAKLIDKYDYLPGK